jgi:hypothetical protein
MAAAVMQRRSCDQVGGGFGGNVWMFKVDMYFKK